MKKLLLLLTCTLSFAIANAQTFTNLVGGAIPDNNVYANYPITVSGLVSNLNTTTFGLESVTINVTHPNDVDLRMKLQSPTGAVWVLTSFYGGTGDNYTNTTFSDTALRQISTGVAPFSGYYRSVDGLFNFNSGVTGNGVWNLQIRDQTVGNVGTVVSWSLKFSSNPAGSVPFTSSNLPIVIIHTVGNAAIPDSPDLGAWMKVIYNGVGVRNYVTDAPNNYNDSIGIQQRGSSSAGFPQKQYNVTTKDIHGLDLDTMLLGMPTEHKWVLYAPYDDKTCMRNVLTYDIGNKMGHWAPHTRFCEVVLNGNYQGIYVFMEKIKRDSNRVNIAKLDSNDVAGDSLTGGYIIKIDKTTGTVTGGWNSNYLSNTGHAIYLQYEYPDGNTMQPIQKTYIQQYVDSFETALTGASFADSTVGYRHYIGVGSFIDYFLVNEISKNVDGYRLSSFFHKDKQSKGGGKLKAGPLWDFNLAWWNANYCSGDLSTGWAYQFNNVCGTDGYQIPFWWDKLLQDPNYANQVKCRWLQLRQTTLSLTTLNNYIDSIAGYLNEAQVRHFQRWPILGVYTWPNPTPLATTYAGEITNMKNWIAARMTWLDANMPGTCSPPIANMTASGNTICSGDSLQFTDVSSSTVDSRVWTFPGGTPATSTNNNPWVTYNTAGTYSVTLTVTNASGTNTHTYTNYVHVNATPAVTVNSSSTCAGTAVTLTAGGATSYTWSAGATSTGVNTATVSPTVTTTYTVTGTSATCSNTAISTITVSAAPVVDAGTGSNYCNQNSTVTLAGFTPAGGTWSGTGIISPTLGTLNPSLLSLGVNILTYTYSAGAGCTATDTIRVNNNASPIVSVNSPTICNGATATLTATGATSYSWSSGGSSAAITVAPTATTTYTVTGTVTATGCATAVNSTVTVNPLPAVNAGASISVCNSPSVTTLTGYSPAGGTWSGTGVTASGDFTPSVAGNFILTYTYTNASTGCVNNDTMVATVISAAVVNAGTGFSVCSGAAPVTLAGTPATGGTWSGTGVSGSSFNPSAGVGNYILTYSYGVGTCASSDTIMVSVTSGPSLAVNSPSVCAGGTAMLVASGADSYSWSTLQSGDTIYVNPAATTTYTVTGSVVGCSGSLNATVTVNPLPVVNAGADINVCNQPIATALTGYTPTGGTWTGTGVTAGGSFTPPGVGTFTLTYTYTNPVTGCSNSDVMNATVVNSAVTDAGPHLTACANDAPLALVGYPSVGGTWFGTGVSGTSFDPTVSGPGTFVVSYYYGTGVCFSIDSMSVTVLPAPPLTVNSPDICAGFNATLNASGASSYLWSTSDVTPSIVVSPAATAPYSVTGTDAITGCTATATSTVTVVPLPDINNSSLNIDICSGQAVAFTPTSTAPGATFAWTFATADAGVTGMSASGSGNVNDVLVNSSAAAGIVTYIITPTGAGPTFCSSSPAVLAVTVNSTPPTPTITQVGTLFTSSSPTGNQGI